jgi:hypothetical protein
MPEDAVRITVDGSRLEKIHCWSACPRDLSFGARARPRGAGVLSFLALLELARLRVVRVMRRASGRS